MSSQYRVAWRIISTGETGHSSAMPKEMADDWAAFGNAKYAEQIVFRTEDMTWQGMDYDSGMREQYRKDRQAVQVNSFFHTLFGV